MTKQDLVVQLADKCDITQVQADKLIDTLLTTMLGALKGGHEIELRGFGTFRFHDRKARMGRNPRTGEAVPVPPKKVLKFRPGKDLKELINTPAA